jgi:hypothetical protein
LKKDRCQKKIIACTVAVLSWGLSLSTALAAAPNSVTYARGALNLAGNQTVSVGSGTSAVSLIMQGDGNLVAYLKNAAVWNSATFAACSSGCRALFQGDGNLVVYDGTTPLFASNTAGTGNKLIFKNSSPYLSVLNKAGVSIWSSSSVPTPPPANPNPNPTVTPTPIPKPTATPANPPPVSSSGLFYGVGGHWVQGGGYTSVPLATQRANLQDIGATLYRQDCYSIANAQLIAKNIPVMAPVKVLPVIIMDAQGSEDSAYNEGYALGAGAAKALKGLVPYYELSNERDNTCIRSGDGNQRGDYDNTCFLANRGALRGIKDGIRSVDASTPVIGGSTAGWLHFMFADMLWNGTTPSSANADSSKQLRWDVTVWHWYNDMGDVTKACGGSGCFNTLNELKTRFGKPIMITEFNTRPDEGNEAQLAVNFTAMLNMWINNAAAYNIIGINVYQLYSDGEGSYGLMSSDGSKKVDRYGTYKNFISAHPK